MSGTKLPRRVQVLEVVQGRYAPGKKPISWDERTAGSDTVRTDTGELLYLTSSGGQSTPAPGWELLLTSENPSRSHTDNPPSYHWTLYGIAKA